MVTAALVLALVLVAALFVACVVAGLKAPFFGIYYVLCGTFEVLGSIAGHIVTAIGEANK